MRLRSIVVTVLFFLFFFASCRVSFADGSYIPDRPNARLPDIPTQRALLKYRDGVETLIIESPFDGDGEKFAWIIPIPSKPHRLESITPGFLKTISFTLQPKVTHRFPYENMSSIERFNFYLFVISWMVCMLLSCFYIIRKNPTRGSIIAFDVVLVPIVFVASQFVFLFAVYGAGPSLSPAATVTVESWQFIGDYEVSVLTADNSGDLNTWLANNGYRKLPEKALPIVDDYIEEKWVFVAAKIAREGDGTSVPHPILIEFNTEKPVYPMRLTALSGSPLNLELFSLASQEAVPVNYNLKKRYCDYFDHEEPPDSHLGYEEASPLHTKLYVARSRGHRELKYAHTIGHPIAMKLMWDGSVMTKLTGKISSDEMNSDMYFWFKEATPFVWHVYSTTWAFKTGIALAIVVGLFGLQVMSFWYGRNREFPSLGLFPLIILGTAVFSATYFGLGTVEVNELISNRDWRYYLSELEANASDVGACYLREAAEESQRVEIANYISRYYKNPASNKQAIIEDSPGNITLVIEENRTSLIAYLWDGTPIILCESFEHIPSPPPVKILVEVATTGESASARESAVAELKELSDPRGTEMLVAALDSDDLLIRKNAVKALGEIGDGEAIQYVRAALNDPEIEVREAAAWELIRSKNPRALESLIAAQRYEDPGVSVMVAWALSKKNDLRGLGTLLGALKDKSPEIRRSAAEALKEIQDPLVVGGLVAALQDESSSVRISAAMTLAHHRDPQMVCPLVEAVNDSDFQVRWYALHILEKMDTEIAEALKNKDSCLHDSMLKTLHEADAPRTVEELIVALQKKHRIARAKNVSALRKQRMQAPAHQAPTLKQKKNRIRNRTLKTLHEADAPRTVEELIVALQDKNETVRAEATAALGKMREPRAFEALIEALGDGNSRVQDSAWRTLEKIDDPRVVEALIAALQHKNPHVRIGAAYALSERKEPRGLQTLLVLVKDEDPRVRGETLAALKQIQDPRAVEALIAALQDESPPVRLRAAIALGHQRDPSALNPLITALDDSDPGVRMWAARALERMASKLVAELDAKDPEVRRTAAMALRKITHKDLGEDSAEWQEWWKQNKKSAPEG